MATVSSICKTLLGVKNVVIDESKTYHYKDEEGVEHLRIRARPDRRHINLCPKCGATCPGYDDRSENKIWRGLDCGPILVEVEAAVNRVQCPQHEVVTASVPWAYERSRFTKDFDLTVAWLATYLFRSAVSES